MILCRHNCWGAIVYAKRVASTLFLFVLASQADAQSPVFVSSLEIDQTKLLTNCPVATDARCGYFLKDVLNSGGDFWTTPFTPYDPAAKSGDGYGEGVNGPRADQRKAFYYRPQQPPYPPNQPPYRFLRMNGLDSQSCFECHNSIGSDPVDARGALSRKPYTVGGSAGSNSNAFINPLFPVRETLFIRNPPAVFGSGYQQAIGDEMTIALFGERDNARKMAMQNPGTPFSQPLTAKGIGFGTFTTTYSTRIAVQGSSRFSICQAGLDHPLNRSEGPCRVYRRPETTGWCLLRLSHSAVPVERRSVQFATFCARRARLSFQHAGFRKSRTLRLR